MKQRIITGLLIILIVFFPLFLGGYLLKGLILAVVAIGSYEIVNVKKVDSVVFYSTIVGLMSLSLVYIFPSYTFLIYILIALVFLSLFKGSKRNLYAYLLLMTLIISFAISGLEHIYEYGPELMFYTLFGCFGSDVGAYFVGVKFGKNKLIESVSPNKTIEGSLGGLFFGFLLSFIWGYFYLDFSLILMFIISILIPIISQIGDLSFSYIKRRNGVKDFGSLFPGHGGVLDRIDSLLFCLILMNIFLLVFEMVN
ncbi:MAG: phosphatidate cytidylyltransferase [Anaerorhabdus sp.]